MVWHVAGFAAALLTISSYLFYTRCKKVNNNGGAHRGWFY